MFRLRLLLAVLLGGWISCTAAAPNAPRGDESRSSSGEIEGSRYRVDFPEHWNGSLVLAAHGYVPPGVPLPDSWPRYEFSSLLLARGYAVASVGYRRQGWALAEGVGDTEALRRWFVSRYGEPHRTYMIGSSMGGLVTIASQESVPNGYDGALALCGAVAPADEGARDRVLGLLVAFDYFFPGHAGGALHGLAAADAPLDLSEPEVERALASDPAKAELLARRFEIRREDLAGHVRFYYVMLRDFVARSGGFPVDNTTLVYAGFGDDAAFNRGVRRYAADPRAVEYLRRHYTPSGRLAHPVLLLGTSYDPTVSAAAADRYLELARAAGNESLVLSRRVPGEGHCRFEADQVGSAFDELVAWVESGRRPVEPSARIADAAAPPEAPGSSVSEPSRGGAPTGGSGPSPELPPSVAAENAGKR